MTDSSPVKRPRPLSPHLQIYSPQLTMAWSILHRITGVGLVVGLALLSTLIMFAATDPGKFNALMHFFTTPFGLIVVAGFVMAKAYHVCAGIRHLIFDTGALLELKQAYAAGYAVLVGTVVITIAVMGFICCALYY